MNPTLSDKASYAVHGMPPSELAKKMVAFENLFQKQRQPWYSFMTRRAQIRILREMIQTLALDHAKLQNSAQAAIQQAASYNNLVKTLGGPVQQREFHMFLQERWPRETEAAMEAGTPMLDFAKKLLEEKAAR